MTQSKRIMRLALAGLKAHQVPLLVSMLTAAASAYHPAAGYAVLAALATIAVIDGILNAPETRE